MLILFLYKAVAPHVRREGLFGTYLYFLLNFAVYLNFSRV